MLPAARGLSSTTTGLPHFFPSASANIRAAASLALPGGNVTISFTGRSGHSARAAIGKARTAQTETMTKESIRRAVPTVASPRRDSISEQWAADGTGMVSRRRQNKIIVASYFAGLESDDLRRGFRRPLPGRA